MCLLLIRVAIRVIKIGTDSCTLFSLDHCKYNTLSELVVHLIISIDILLMALRYVFMKLSSVLLTMNY